MQQGLTRAKDIIKNPNVPWVDKIYGDDNTITYFCKKCGMHAKYDTDSLYLSEYVDLLNLFRLSHAPCGQEK